MFYVCIKKVDEDRDMVCICKAVSAKEAKRMTGTPDNSVQWISLTSDQIQSLLSAREGYIGKVI